MNRRRALLGALPPLETARISRPRQEAGVLVALDTFLAGAGEFLGRLPLS